MGAAATVGGIAAVAGLIGLVGWAATRPKASANKAAPADCGCGGSDHASSAREPLPLTDISDFNPGEGPMAFPGVIGYDNYAPLEFPMPPRYEGDGNRPTILRRT